MGVQGEGLRLLSVFVLGSTPASRGEALSGAIGPVGGEDGVAVDPGGMS